jgi:hypothetical protein
MDETFTPEYQKAIDNLMDVIAEMKLSGDYDEDTLETIIWRMS